LAKTQGKTPNKSVEKIAPPPDTREQQIAARALLLLGAALGLAMVVGGAWLFTRGFTATHMLPTRVGIGFVMMAGGAIGCWAGLYCARHGRLQGGKLRFDKQAQELVTSPFFIRCMKVAGHTAGITLLAVSWLAVYYPNGLAMQ
jgi:hypothetical protein